MTSALLALWLLAPGEARAMQGVCRAVTCFDGSQCDCTPGCCEKKYKGRQGSGSSGSTGGGYNPQMAVMELYGNMLNQFFSFQQKQQQEQQAQQAQQAAFQAEQQRLAEMQAAAAAAERRAQAQREFEDLRDSSASQMKEQSPDLSKTLEFKNEEPVRYIAPANNCGKEMPPLLSREAFALDSDEQFKKKADIYRDRMAKWETRCGASGASGLIRSASTVNVAAAIAYQSRMNSLMKGGWTASKSNQYYDLELSRDEAVAGMSEKERIEFESHLSRRSDHPAVYKVSAMLGEKWTEGPMSPKPVKPREFSFNDAWQRFKEYAISKQGQDEIINRQYDGMKQQKDYGE
jgi:multidrug efflux pump subunit AcrA (membrane-fusion protein)